VQHPGSADRALKFADQGRGTSHASQSSRRRPAQKVYTRLLPERIRELLTVYRCNAGEL
jgi:hypothetical protein